MGMKIPFDASPGNIDVLPQLMIDFSLAFAAGDAEALEKLVSSDFVWHMNYTENEPAGRTVRDLLQSAQIPLGCTRL